MKIVVLEDDADQLLALKRRFAKTGHEVTYGQDGSALFEMLPEIGTIDAIVTDNQMGEMSGLDVIKELAKQGLNIPVLLRSGDSQVRIGDWWKPISGVIKPYSFATYQPKGVFDLVAQWLDSLESID